MKNRVMREVDAYAGAARKAAGSVKYTGKYLKK